MKEREIGNPPKINMSLSLNEVSSEMNSHSYYLKLGGFAGIDLRGESLVLHDSAYVISQIINSIISTIIF